MTNKRELKDINKKNKVNTKDNQTRMKGEKKVKKIKCVLGWRYVAYKQEMSFQDIFTDVHVVKLLFS